MTGFTLMGTADGGLAEALSAAGHAVALRGWQDAGGVGDAVVVLPVTNVAGWDGVADALSVVFAGCQRIVTDGTPRSITLLIPAACAMGDPGDGAGSALAGGLLSLARTWAIELRKTGVPVNCLMVDGLAACADLLVTLAGQPGCAITGQEIFVAGGSDVGRLRP